MPASDPLRVLIVDDEALARKSVARHLRAVLPDATVREARDGFEALDLIRDFSPQLVFLDVEMPELSGLDVLRQLEVPRPKIIFATAFEHFAVKAFEENACDYLVKPFTEARVGAAVERVLRQLDAESKLRGVERSFEATGHYLTRLALKVGPRVDVVQVAQVRCFVSKGHYSYVYAGEREYISDLTLVHLEERLDPSVFVRIHRNALVNQSCIKRVIDGEPTMVELDDGTQLELSRRNRGALMKRYREFERG
jgi:two-component system LytT family response regulator